MVMLLTGMATTRSLSPVLPPSLLSARLRARSRDSWPWLHFLFNFFSALVAFEVFLCHNAFIKCIFSWASNLCNFFENRAPGQQRRAASDDELRNEHQSPVWLKIVWISNFRRPRIWVWRQRFELVNLSGLQACFEGNIFANFAQTKKCGQLDIRSVFVEFTSRENALERLPRFGRKPTVFFSTVEYKTCFDSRPFCANDLIMVTMILFCALPRISHP